MTLLRAVPEEYRSTATSIRQFFRRKYGQTATKRLDKVRGTFAASCYAEGLIADPGPEKRVLIPKEYHPAVLYHFLTARKANGLVTNDPAVFYKGTRLMKRLYAYASNSFGGWPAALDAVSRMTEPPTLPDKYHLAYM
jgi:hypothetical protein